MKKMEKFYLGISITVFYLWSFIPVYAEGETKAKIESPEGLLKDSAKFTSAVDSFNWILQMACLATAILCGLRGANKLANHQYVEAIGPCIASLLAGVLTYIINSVAQ